MKCVLCLCPCVLHFLVMSRNKILCSMYHARFPKCTHSMQRPLESWKAISDFCTVKGIGPENIACKRSEMKIFCTYVCKLFKLWFMCLSQRILSRQKERQLFLFPQKAPHVFFYEGRKKNWRRNFLSSITRLYIESRQENWFCPWMQIHSRSYVKYISVNLVNLSAKNII